MIALLHTQAGGSEPVVNMLSTAAVRALPLPYKNSILEHCLINFK